MKIRHINNIPPMNFAISSKELYITIDEMKGGQIAKNLLISTEPPYIRYYNSIFEGLWNKSVPAEQKVKEIEEGVILGKTEVIQSPEDIQQLFIDMVKSANHEVLLVLPTVNAFYRKERIGIIKASSRKRTWSKCWNSHSYQRYYRRKITKHRVCK
jgi:hypothetical protein